VGEFDYLQHALKLAGRKSRVSVRVAEGANHSFANRLGREAVRVHTETWLDEFFPLEPSLTPSASTLETEPQDSEGGHEFQEQVLKVQIPHGKVRINANDCSI
jgi:hypothetical protein